MRSLCVISLVILVAACRGGISDSPPLHVVPDMDDQPKLKAQSRSGFENWTDHRAMRLPVAGTVARGDLREGPLYTWKTSDEADYTDAAQFVSDNPVPLTMAVMERGRERFNITCAVCHGLSGRGGSGPAAHGIVGRYWTPGVLIPSFIPPGPEATEDERRVSLLNDGQIFEVITKGRNTMPSYAHMIPVEDRWAIIHYIRALQYQSLN